MSIIQDIREKYAKLTVAVIAIALLGFVLTDYFSSKARSGGGMGSTVVGRVNGKKIDDKDFRRKVEITQNNLSQQGYPSDMAFSQALEQMWNQEVERIVLQEQYDKLGIVVGKKELNDLLYGPQPSSIAQQYLMPQGQPYDPTQVLQTVTQIRKQGTAEQKNQLNELLEYIVQERLKEKFNAMLANSSNQPRWRVEKQIADNSQVANISYVSESYASQPDSLYKVEDKEIADYVSKHKTQFKQKESRSINYVTFSAAPSSADSLEVKKRLNELRPAFDSTNNIELYLAGEGVSNFYDGYKSGSQIQSAFKDSITRLPIGGIYGPFLENGNFVLAKLLGAKQMPDTVKVRHILIGTMQRDPQSGQMYPIRDTTTAYKLCDSIRNEIAKGSNFDSLCLKFSDDPGKNDQQGNFTGGVYDNVPSGQMVPTFNDFIFLNPPGSKGIVKTTYGYHYIEVLSHKGSGMGYKIAELPKEIIASQETDNAALNAANSFFGDSPDQQAYDNTYEQKLKPQGKQKGVATDIKPVSSDIRGLGSSRTLVRNIYEAKKGEVIRPERVGDNYVVAVVTEVFEDGTQGVNTARPLVEPILRNKKKAQALITKIGKITTLEAASAAMGGKQIEGADSLRISNSPVLGYEPRVIGAAFNPNNKGKVVPEAIEGVNGVYVVRVDSTGATAVMEGSVTERRQADYTRMKQATYPYILINTLKEAATIKDNRAKRY